MPCDDYLSAQWACLNQQIAIGMTDMGNIGLPDRRSLILLKRTQTDSIYTEITPSPFIRTVSTREVARYANIPNVNVSLEDLMVEGISRDYPREQILTASLFIIDGTFVDSTTEPVGGFIANLVSGTTLTEKSIYLWDNLMLRKGRANRIPGGV